MSRPTRPVRLQLHSFEDRLTPATSVYSHGTLTVTASSGDVIVVQQNNSAIPGYLRVTAGVNPVFDSVASQPVKNLVVKAGSASTYTLDFGPDVALSKLTVNGASANTTVILRPTTRVNQDFTFTAARRSSANDDFTFTPGSRVGGNVNLNLGDGSNVVNLNGATVGGNLIVTGGSGVDVVNLANAGTTVVSGNVGLTLGNGLNQVNGVAANSVRVGGSFSFAGGSDDDTLDFATAGTFLAVGGPVNLKLGEASINGNVWRSAALFVGGKFAAGGGSGNDTVSFYGATEIGGDLSATMSNGTNFLTVGFAGGARTTVGGNVTYQGGSGYDEVDFDNLAVAGNTRLTLGNGGGLTQQVIFGRSQAAIVDLSGNLQVSTGDDADDVILCLTRVGGSLSVSTGGGNDRVFLDDIDVSGTALIALGNGGDLLSVENQNNNGIITLVGNARFGSSLTVQGGNDNDTVDLSQTGGTASDLVRVGGNLSIRGGGGTDTFVHYEQNVYLQGKFEDCENGEGL